MRLIDVKSAIKELRDAYEHEFPTASGEFDDYATRIVPNILRNMETVDAQPVKHGRWEFVNLAKSYLEAPCGDTLRCSVCNFVVDVSEQTPYCPNCGAKMDLEGE